MLLEGGGAEGRQCAGHKGSRLPQPHEEDRAGKQTHLHVCVLVGRKRRGREGMSKRRSAMSLVRGGTSRPKPKIAADDGDAGLDH